MKNENNIRLNCFWFGVMIFYFKDLCKAGSVVPIVIGSVAIVFVLIVTVLMVREDRK